MGERGRGRIGGGYDGFNALKRMDFWFKIEAG